MHAASEQAAAIMLLFLVGCFLTFVFALFEKEKCAWATAIVFCGPGLLLLFTTALLG